MKITTIGIDLAKTTLSVHAVDAHGKTAMHKSLSRAKLLQFMSARSGAWRTRFRRDGGQRSGVMADSIPV